MNATSDIAHTLPSDVRAYKRTPVFSDATLPAGLRNDHATKAGVWGRINVLEGQLRYIIPAAGIDVMLDPGTPGIITPQQIHRVEPVGDVRFFVEFLK